MDCTHPLWSRTIKQKTTPRNARGGFLRLPMVDGGRRPSGGPGTGSPVASPYSVGVGVVAGGGWIPDVIGCRVQDGMTLREAREGLACGKPLRRWGRGCGWRRMDRGCRGSGDSGWNENEPSGGAGDGRCLWRAPTALGSGVVVVRGCMTGWGCVRWLGCMRDFDTNGVGVPRRGTLPGLRSGQISKLAKIFCHVIIYKIIT